MKGSGVARVAIFELVFDGGIIARLWGAIMNLRLLSAGIFLLAAYLAFGDFLLASTRSSPKTFVENVASGIGGAIMGLATRVELFFGG